MKYLLMPFKWILKTVKKIKRRILLAKTYVKLERGYKRRLADCLVLKKNVMKFLAEFYGIDANSDYIPKDFKSKEEVRVAVTDKFGKEMKRLNIDYSYFFN